MSKTSTPTPIALPNDLIAEIAEAAEFTKMTKQDVMRLAMRIGLVDLRASQEIAGILQQLATDKGQSFLAWAREKQTAETAAAQKSPQPVQAAASPAISASLHQPKKPTASIAKLPRPTTPTSAKLKTAEDPAAYKFTDRRQKRG